MLPSRADAIYIGMWLHTASASYYSMLQSSKGAHHKSRLWIRLISLTETTGTVPSCMVDSFGTGLVCDKPFCKAHILSSEHYYSNWRNLIWAITEVHPNIHLPWWNVTFSKFSRAWTAMVYTELHQNVLSSDEAAVDFLQHHGLFTDPDQKLLA